MEEKKMVYLDNAATTKMHKEVVDSMLPFFEEVYGNASSLHEMGQVAKENLENARKVVADCIGAKQSEIYFTSGGSESDNWAIKNAFANGLKEGKNHIISCKIEHHAVLHTLEKLKKDGAQITLLNVDEFGLINLEELENAITDKTCLVSIMFANNEIGTIEPIEEIAEICHKKGVLFHTDAVQAVGHTPINVVELGIDMLSLSGHKFHGPKGVGVLYVKKGIKLNNLIDGGAQEFNKRAGTENLAGVVGLAKALQIACENMEKNNKKQQELRNYLIKELSKIEHSKLNGHILQRLSNNVNMCFEGIEGESLLLLLSDMGICASSGSACTSGSLDPSHVLLAIGLPHEVAHGSLRLSLSEYTTREEIDYTIEKVKEVVALLRKMSPVWDKLQKGEIKHVI